MSRTVRFLHQPRGDKRILRRGGDRPDRLNYAIRDKTHQRVATAAGSPLQLRYE
jgi:hypothetical protein